jgi:hypothetical protein
VSGPGSVTFSASGLLSTTATFSAPGTYILRLTASAGGLTSTDDVVVTVTASPGSGTGLLGQYYQGQFATFLMTRTDATVNFDWGDGAPGAGVPADDFSVRWSGQVQAPVTGTYTFSTVSDDGVRLWVNGQLVIDNWTDRAATTDTSAAIALVGGTKYDLRMEYYEHKVLAVARLQWAYPGQTMTVIPQSQLFPSASGTGLTGQYYQGQFGTLLMTRTDATVNFDWGDGAPGAGVPANDFSVRWSGQVQAPVTGTYTFSTVSDDGVRLWVNGQLVIDNWTDHAATADTSAAIALVGGTRYDLRMEYYEHKVLAVARLQWAYPGQTVTVIPQSRLFP